MGLLNDCLKGIKLTCHCLNYCHTYVVIRRGNVIKKATLHFLNIKFWNYGFKYLSSQTRF